MPSAQRGRKGTNCSDTSTPFYGRSPGASAHVNKYLTVTEEQGPETGCLTHSKNKHGRSMPIIRRTWSESQQGPLVWASNITFQDGRALVTFIVITVIKDITKRSSLQVHFASDFLLEEGFHFSFCLFIVVGIGAFKVFHVTIIPTEIDTDSLEEDKSWGTWKQGLLVFLATSPPPQATDVEF